MPLSHGFRPSAGRPPQARQPELRYLVLDGISPGEQDAGRGRGGNRALALKLMEEPMSLAMRFDEWEAEFLQKGRKEGREEGWAAERGLLQRLAVRRFDATTADALSGMLADVRDAERFAEVGEFIVDCATGPELLEQVRRTNGRFE